MPHWLKSLSGDAVRYLLSGGVVYCVDLATFLLLHHFLEPDYYATANIAGKVAGAATGYVLHSAFTFRGEKTLGSGHRLARYGAMMLFNLALSAGLLWTLVEMAGLPVTPSRIAVDLAVIATSFLVSRHLVFRRTQEDRS